MPAPARIAYLCTDLLFTSKIRETARALGQDAAGARDPAGLAEAARGAALVVIDLRRPDALDALARLRADEATRAVPAYCFIDHELVDRMEEARRAGATEVLAKGRFSSELRNLLGGVGGALPRSEDRVH
jgi:CheY-like chemotaxis protein